MLARHAFALVLHLKSGPVLIGNETWPTLDECKEQITRVYVVGEGVFYPACMAVTPGDGVPAGIVYRRAEEK